MSFTATVRQQFLIISELQEVKFTKVEKRYNYIFQSIIKGVEMSHSEGSQTETPISFDNPSPVQKNQSEKVPKKREQFKKERNWQTQQICFIIGLLNLVGDMTLEQPSKMETKALALFKVSHVMLDDKFFDVKSMTKDRVQYLINKDKANNILPSTIKKRAQIYRVLEHIHVLMDILSETRFKYSTCPLKINFIHDKRTLDVVDVDSMMMFKNDIERIGTNIHHALIDMVKYSNTSHVFRLPRGNTEFMSLFFDEH